MKAKKIAKKKVAKKVKKYDFDKPDVVSYTTNAIRACVEQGLLALSLVEKSKKIVVTYKLSPEGKYNTDWDTTF